MVAIGLAGVRLAPPYTAVGVGRLLGPDPAPAVAARLAALAETGMRPGHLVVVTEAILAARAARQAPDAVELVWTGPEPAGAANRDTAVVVREVFARAAETVVVAGFALFRGRDVFRGLADRMAAVPRLRVRLFLDVRRGPQDVMPEAEVVRRFARHYVEYDWPDGFRSRRYTTTPGRWPPTPRGGPACTPSVWWWTGGSPS